MAIKTTEIRDKVQILEGTVQKQMILDYVLFQTKKMLFLVVISTTTLFASIIANGRQHLLVSLWLDICPAPCSFRLLDIFLKSPKINILVCFKKVEKKNKKKNKTKLLSVSVATFKYLSCHQVKKLQPDPIFKFVCRHILLRFDILPISALYFRKVFWPVIYNMAMRYIQRWREGAQDAWLALGECRQKHDEAKTQI